MNEKINQEDVRTLYNGIENIWPENDQWYNYTHQQITNFLKHYEKVLNINSNTLILNAGSAGNDYGISGKHIHLDIAEKHLVDIPNSIVGSIEQIPIEDNIFDVCICVGSVINYCDAFTALNEIKRILKPNGYLILDYDQSKSFEFVGTSTYNKNIDMVHTFNSGSDDKIWVYSDNYMSSILNEKNFKIINKKFYHNISPLIYKLTNDEYKSSKFAFLDKIACHIPILRNVSCNIILIAQTF